MGSRSTQTTKVPAYIEEAGKLALQRAQEIQGMGYIPYTGPEIAAISDTERALNRNVRAMASAFGLEGPAPLSMGDAELTSAGGVSGYSSYPAYMAAMERLKEQRPDQYAYLSSMIRFDPITGAENPNFASQQKSSIFAGTPLAKVSNIGGGNSHEARHAASIAARSPAPSGSGGFDPLGPSGNYSINAGGGVKKLFGNLLFGG